MFDIARTPHALPLRPDADPEADAEAEAIAALQSSGRLFAAVRGDDARTLEQQVLLASTPAPPFAEERRARLMAELLAEAGTTPPITDAVGNVLAWMGEPGARPLVVSAHLDTVFPESQEISIREEGGCWVGPGICDDARGLAALLALARALVAAEPPRYPVLLVGTVGEEGAGNLRGVRHLFGPDGAGHDARGFISLDGAGSTRVIASGVGSRRLRATVTGPGGHSWVDWGRVNPIHVLARAVADFQDIELAAGTTMSVGRVEGGTSVNAIPSRAWIEFESRSEDEAELERMERVMAECLSRSLAGANQAGSNADEHAALAVEVIGRRPAGVTDPSSPLVRAALAASRVVAGDAELAASSTDANLPMSLGIPAVTLGAGGEAGEAHTVNEWYRNVKGPEGVLRALMTLRVLDRLED